MQFDNKIKFFVAGFMTLRSKLTCLRVDNWHYQIS